ncbi:MAG: GHKL domain-containing protein [bacterium]|nr:GHKL domain-containing protein [bacterium]
MKTVSLKVKFLIPLTIVITIMIIFFNYGYSVLELDLDVKNIEKESNIKTKNFNFTLKYLEGQKRKILELLLDKLMDNQKVLKAFENNNREMLYKYSSKYYHSFKTDYNVTHMYFIKPDGKCFMRVHHKDRYTNKKELFGDIIKRNTFLSSVKNADTASGLEFGHYGSLTYRCVKPWIVSNKIVGYIEIGIELNKLLATLEKAMDCKIIITLADNKSNLFYTSKNVLATKNPIFINRNLILKKIASSKNKLSSFKFDNKGNNLSCTLFTYNFTNNLKLPVLIINNDVFFNPKNILSSIILYGSIVFGLIIFAIFLRITEGIEKKLNQREEELAESNQELENFAYIASHDLKAPLRAIENLAIWIEDDLENVNEHTKEQLELLKGRSNRMIKLLDSLLEYSRVGKTKENMTLVNVNKMLDNILYTISQPKGFKIELSNDLPEFKTYYTPLYQVFLNLIVNALKHHNKTNGKISIRSESYNNFYKFYVEDDGPGISSKYHDKIFELFQTLKSKDQVEGVGMGLSIIKKTVEKFGGTITLESEVGKGTTFIFSWPMNYKL